MGRLRCEVHGEEGRKLVVSGDDYYCAGGFHKRAFARIVHGRESSVELKDNSFF
jgi:hypothetical protein